ncbi:LytTR family DNA-binding domain-containing protein [uncultured Dokdonia sp.]|uniref:LytR/AlgR family response regulator transcription factor n=1 Tax=uncultured Dokdonia sp. TaxID=575653 RepID=UPI00261D5540|nr:LytTR family DNA-binding domain-containing protein [uncultured Dokdonia sp.]
MIRCIVVDDEPLARSLLEQHIADVPFLEHKGSFKNALLASQFLATNQVDVLFLDIQMPKLTGIDFLKSLSHRPTVIFTTAYREYAVESYELQAHDYLLKPITFERFFTAVSRLKVTTPTIPSTIETTSQETHTASAHIFVQMNKKYVKVILQHVQYVESIKDYLKIHTTTETLVIKERISHFIEQLPGDQFLRVHRSYIVNRDHITAFTQQDIEIGRLEIPIGGKYKEHVIGILKAQ